MIAMLGMYDMPVLHAANDRFWQAIRAHLGEGPDRLTRDQDPWEVWQSPDLLFAQTCGMPYRTRLHDKVQLVGTPDYGLPGCPPGYYNSVFIARSDDPRDRLEQFSGTTFAYNEALSQSGWAAPMVHLSGLNIHPGKTLMTGAHAASARAVAEGHADMAGLDALTWALLRQHDPVAQGLRETARTEPTPALPYITAKGRDPDRIATAVELAIRDLDQSDRDALHLKGLVRIPKADYMAVPTPPGP